MASGEKKLSFRCRMPGCNSDSFEGLRGTVIFSEVCVGTSGLSPFVYRCTKCSVWFSDPEKFSLTAEEQKVRTDLLQKIEEFQKEFGKNQE